MDSGPTRTSRLSERQERKKELDAKGEAAKSSRLVSLITHRLSSVPESWRRKYDSKLESEGMRPEGLHSAPLEELERRRYLLPPDVEYRHHTSKTHPSSVERRATSCIPMFRFNRDSVSKNCPNKTVLSSNTYTDVGIKRFAPKNVRAYKVGDSLQCLTRSLIQTYHSKGYTVDNSYQNDASAREWPEMIVSAGEGKPHFRLPFHVAAECGDSLHYPKDPSLRKHPPHQNEY